jgi:hypothetical protein
MKDATLHVRVTGRTTSGTATLIPLACGLKSLIITLKIIAINCIMQKAKTNQGGGTQ